MNPRHPSLIRAAFSVGAIYAFGSLVGFAQRMVVTSRFGASADYDAFNAAFRVPDLLFNLMAGGALASAFIPVYAGYLGRDQRAHAWRLARVVALLVLAVLSGLAVLAAAVAPAVVDAVIAPGFTDAQAQLTVSLMRAMLVATVIFGLSGLLMGVLQSNGSFIPPALAPSLYNAGIIFGALALGDLGIHGVAAGVVIGAVLHLGVQLPALGRIARISYSVSRILHPGLRGSEGLSLSAESGTRHTKYGMRNTECEIRNPSRVWPDVRRILALMVPRIVGLGAVQLNFIVNTNLASAMGSGAVSAVAVGFAVMLLPQAAIAQAVATVLFPAISAHAARGEREAFGAKLTRAVNAVLALSLPASLALIVLGQPLIRLLFQRGAFDAEDARAVSFALAWFATGLVGHSVLEVVARGFYALQDTLRPVVLGVASMALNVALSLILSSAFGSAGLYPFGGLALANSLATALETAVLFGMLARRVPEIRVPRVAVTAIQCALAALVMAAALWLGLQAAGEGTAVTLLAVPAGALIYFAAAYALGNRDVRATVATAAIRIQRLVRKI